jgi:hypothetical protein
MRDEILFRARRLFAEFRQAFADKSGSTTWWLTFDGEDLERMNMTTTEFDGAQALLLDRDLVERMGMDGLRLTASGREACLSPERLNQILGPARDLEGSVVHVSGQTVVVGNNNTVQVNTDELVQQLANALQRSSAVEPEQRSRWLEALKDIGAHLASSAVKVVVDRIAPALKVARQRRRDGEYYTFGFGMPSSANCASNSPRRMRRLKSS